MTSTLLTELVLVSFVGVRGPLEALLHFQEVVVADSR